MGIGTLYRSIWEREQREVRHKSTHSFWYTSLKADEGDEGGFLTLGEIMYLCGE